MKGSKGKSPAIQWYYKDWLSDRKLQRAHPVSRGIWMNLLMHMIDCSIDSENCKEGVLEDVTITELMQLGSCDEESAWQFVEDAIKHEFCNIELDKNRTFHIMSRRLARDKEKREYWRKYKQLQREQKEEKKECPTVVRAKSASSPIPTPSPTPNKGNTYSADFLKFYSAYPLKKGKGKAYSSWKKQKPNLSLCLTAIQDQTREKRELREAGKFCAEWKHPATWLNHGCWEDEVYSAEPERRYVK